MFEANQGGMETKIMLGLLFISLFLFEANQGGMETLFFYFVFCKFVCLKRTKVGWKQFII